MIQLLKSVSNSLNDTMVHLNEVINIRTNIDLALEPLNLNQNIEMVTQLLSNQITEKEVTLSITIPQNTILNYNPAYLESILYNLISNAIRYRSPKRKPRIEINWYIENEYKVLEITDNGIGIDLKQNKDKIFGMYKTFTKNPDSKGIGLFITKNQIDAMGGKITIESEIDKGTTFRIYFK
jgi:signal transduction histidine kinase